MIIADGVIRDGTIAYLKKTKAKISFSPKNRKWLKNSVNRVKKSKMLKKVLSTSPAAERAQ